MSDETSTSKRILLPCFLSDELKAIGFGKRLPLDKQRFFLEAFTLHKLWSSGELVLAFDANKSTESSSNDLLELKPMEISNDQVLPRVCMIVVSLMTYRFIYRI